MPVPRPAHLPRLEDPRPRSQPAGDARLHPAVRGGVEGGPGPALPLPVGGSGGPPRRQGALGSPLLFEGAWKSDRSLRYPFRLEAPAGPPTYKGHSLSVDWYLHVEADVAQAAGSGQHALEEKLTLLPAAEES